MEVPTAAKPPQCSFLPVRKVLTLCHDAPQSLHMSRLILGALSG
jgi:hypothetical protein